VEMAILPKATHIKIPMTFFTEIGKSILKFIGKHTRPRKAKAILSKKRNAINITIHNSKQHFRTIIMKTAWYQHKNRYSG
jgi:hypothetical protein